MIVRICAAFLGAVSFFTLFTPNATAATKTSLVKTFKDWSVYTSGQGKAKICFALSQPKRRTPKGLKRGSAHVFISHRLSDGVRNEFSVIMGYASKPGTMRLIVDGVPFNLLTKNENAWLKDTNDRSRLISAFRKGRSFMIESVSKRGNATKDYYSLSGSAAAIDLARKQCR